MLKAVQPFARHLRGKRGLITTVFLLGLAGSAASLATPLIGKSFIDAVAVRGDYHLVPGIAAALLAQVYAGSLARPVGEGHGPESVGHDDQKPAVWADLVHEGKHAGVILAEPHVPQSARDRSGSRPEKCGRG